jgi:hypothetical protein
MFLHDPHLGEESFFPNDDWECVDGHKLWKRKVPATQWPAENPSLPQSLKEFHTAEVSVVT